MIGAMVTIDLNEHAHHSTHKATFESMGALCEVKQLPYDFEIACPDGEVVTIERKTPRDLLDSIKDGRLFNQVADMVAKTRWAYVIIEGGFLEVAGTVAGSRAVGEYNYPVVYDEFGESTAWSWESVQGALLTVQDMGAGVVCDSDFHGGVKRLVNRSRGDVKIAPRRHSYTFSPHEAFYMAFDGIGSKKAIDLARTFPFLGDGIAWLHEYDEGDKQPKIAGIGNKQIEKNIRLSGGRFFFVPEKVEQ